MRVRDVMTRDVPTIAADDTIENAGNRMTEAGVRQLVVRGKRSGVVGVISRGHLVGIVTVWDILNLVEGGETLPKRSVDNRQALK